MAHRMEHETAATAGTSLVPATMNIGQAASYLGMSKATLYTWRTRRPGFGPRAVKAGGALRYRKSDLDDWIEAHAETLDLEPDVRAAVNQQSYRHALGSLSRASTPRRR